MNMCTVPTNLPLVGIIRQQLCTVSTNTDILASKYQILYRFVGESLCTACYYIDAVYFLNPEETI